MRRIRVAPIVAPTMAATAPIMQPNRIPPRSADRLSPAFDRGSASAVSRVNGAAQLRSARCCTAIAALTSPTALPYKPRDFARARHLARGPFGCDLIVADGMPRNRRSPREADLSTEQAGAQASARLPRPHGNQGRPPRDRLAALAGPQAAQRLIAPSSARRFMERLKQRAEFLAASRGIKVPVSAFVLQVRCRGDAGPPRFGFTGARTFGHSGEVI